MQCISYENGVMKCGVGHIYYAESGLETEFPGIVIEIGFIDPPVKSCDIRVLARE